METDKKKGSKLKGIYMYMYSLYLAGLNTANGVLYVLKLNEGLSETGHHSNVPGETNGVVYSCSRKRMRY